MLKLRSSVVACVLANGCYSGAAAGPDTDVADDTVTGDGGGDTGVGACEGQDGGLADRARLRRLTRFEFNNTVRDLLGDDTLPGNAFPSEVIGNGFGNDANAQPVSSLLVEQYAAVAESVAARATETPERLAALAPCTSTVTDATEGSCARTLLDDLVSRAYRRPLAPGELDEIVALQQTFRAEADFAGSIAAVIETVLQSADFLYRVEHGTIDAEGRLRPTDHEMATRLSYFLWGTMPDDTLRAAAEAGELSTPSGVRAQAERMLADGRSRLMVRFFFDNLLPISSLSALERDAVRYPKYTGAIGALMREETHQFLAHHIFEGDGSWQGALTAEYTFMNEALAEYYGVAGVVGEEFREVALDTTQRLGVLTQAGVVAGTIHSNESNPVVRGSFLVQKIMCTQIPLPTGDVLAEIKPPDPDSGATARERFSQHSSDPACVTCHLMMDPVGFPLENYDAIGLWRDTENGVTIDASGSVPGTEGTVDGPVELVRKIATAEPTGRCFALHWANFAYGRTHAEEDSCVQEAVTVAFTDSGFDIRELLVTLTQTDAFLYMPAGEQ